MSTSSDLGIRALTGLLLIAGAVLLIWFGGGAGASSAAGDFLGAWTFRAAVAAIAAFMLVEWNSIHKLDGGWSIAAAALLAILLMILAEWLFPVAQIDDAMTSSAFRPVLPGWALVAGAGLLAGAATRRPSLSVGFLYVGIPALALMVLEWGTERVVLWVMVATWSTDIFAYFAGRSFGGPKLAPRISPNKTWSGLIGGMAGAAVLGWMIALLLGLGAPFLLLGAPMALLAQAGDLFESWIKRRAGVKDSGSILPGHGGLLDRLDGLLPLLVVTTILLMAGIGVE